MEHRVIEERYPISKVFRDAFPHYLAIGMPAEAYWDGESWLVKSYREAYRLRMENEERISDRNEWRMGEYIRRALISVPIIVNGFMPKGAKLHDYPERPVLEEYDLQRQAEEKQNEQKAREEKEQKLALAMFQAFAEKMNKGIRKRLDAEAAEKEIKQTEV